MTPPDARRSAAGPRRGTLRRARSILISRLGGAGLRALGWYARSLSRRRASRLGELLGGISMRCFRYRREVALRNIRFALDPSEAEARRVLRASFDNFAKCLVEFVRMPGDVASGRISDLVRLEGEERLRAAHDRGKGVILLTAHYGNWELVGARLAAAGYPLNVLARHQYDEGTTRLVDGVREAAGMRVLQARTGDSTRVLGCLRKGEIVGFVADQNAGHEGLFVEFFGRLASTHAGAAFFALRTGAAVVPVFGIRNADDTHTAVIHPEIELVQSGHLRQDIKANTALFAQVIEQQIRAQPDFWFWVHDRWKTRPPGE